ncbi:MAG: hypothetical protein H0T69_14505 [Thermoleophilaceae bacterium]|nr:hypothetical protein [Thermoleophilaceae bacterium]
MIGRLGALANRRLGERERHGLFGLAAGVIVCAAALLLALPADLQPQSRPVGAPLTAAPPAQGAAPAERSNDLGEAEATARRFLGGYLRLLYGRGPATAIAAATDRLRHRLARTRVRVTPAARRRRPRIIDIQIVPVRGGGFAATAEIGDGGPARYPIELAVARHRGGWRVFEVADH